MSTRHTHTYTSCKAVLYSLRMASTASPSGSASSGQSVSTSRSRSEPHTSCAYCASRMHHLQLRSAAAQHRRLELSPRQPLGRLRRTLHLRTLHVHVAGGVPARRRRLRRPWTVEARHGRRRTGPVMVSIPLLAKGLAGHGSMLTDVRTSSSSSSVASAATPARKWRRQRRGGAQ